MSDIICASCTIKIPEEKEAGAAFRTGTDEQVGLQEVLQAGVNIGVKPSTMVEYLNDGESHPGLPQYEFRLVVKTVETEVENVFDGSPEEAEEAGWQENEFGWVCPGCSDTAHTTEDGTGAYQDQDLVTQVAVLAAVGPEVIGRPAAKAAIREALTGLVVQEAEAQGLEVDEDA